MKVEDVPVGQYYMWHWVTSEGQRRKALWERLSKTHVIPRVNCYGKPSESDAHEIGQWQYSRNARLRPISEDEACRLIALAAMTGNAYAG